MIESADWGVVNQSGAANVAIASADGDEVLDVTVPGAPDRSVLSAHSAICTLGAAGLPWPAQAATFSYEMFVPAGIDWGLQGYKLPGLAGKVSGTGTQLGQGGTLYADAWSGRLMVYSPADTVPANAAKGGRPFGYLYVPELDGVAHITYGQAVDFSTALVEGEWNTLALTYEMNRPGRADGVFAATLNGTEAARSESVVYRTPAHPTLGITHIWLDVYAGGAGNVGPASPQTLRFRRHRVDGVAYA